ncbi:MAG: Ppx/GppA family phosphatase [Firmicutes bacterium]|nr:Ppx/GppA family phosphatase [Bacillota bacterium]
MNEGRVRRLHFEMETTRIGAGMAAHRELNEERMAATLEALDRCRQVVERWDARLARAVATSAVREAINGPEFARRAAQVLGAPLEVISGEEEAYLSYLGVAGGLPEIKRPLVLDIGGGSSELIWMGDSGLEAHSLRVGAVSLTEDAARLAALEEGKHLFGRLSQEEGLTLVGVGGTATTLAAIELGMETYDPDRVQGFSIAVSEAWDIYDRLASLTLEQRMRVTGLQPSRADIILAGIQILLEIMRRCGKDHLVVGESDLLYGIIQSAGSRKL